MRLLVLVFGLVVVAKVVAATLPHVLFIVADDLGYNDVGYHGAELPTPNIDSLAGESVRLENYHVFPVCTPFRSSALTGRYPIRYGLQHDVIKFGEPHGLSLNETLLPEILKGYGYTTHAIGKWHLGFYSWAFTPTYRGFDSFYGYYGSDSDYFRHFKQVTISNVSVSGFDLRSNERVASEDNGEYSAFLFVREVERVLKQRAADQPLFLYLPFQNAHAPQQVPEAYIEETACKTIPNANRRIYCGMVNALDDAVGKVVSLFKQYGLWDNTLLVFTTDNGGTQNTGGNNLPFRGQKSSLFEGGVRGVGFVRGNMLGRTGVSNGLTHAVDWLPTIEALVQRANSSSAALSNTKLRLPLDGNNILDHLLTDSPVERNEVLLNIDPVTGPKAIIVSGWKYMIEKNEPYYIIPEQEQVEESIKPAKAGKPIAQSSALFEWLFDLNVDPLESTNLADVNPEKLAELRLVLERYEKEMVPAGNKPETLDADPAKFGGNWTPWL